MFQYFTIWPGMLISSIFGYVCLNIESFDMSTCQQFNTSIFANKPPEFHLNIESILHFSLQSIWFGNLTVSHQPIAIKEKT